MTRIATEIDYKLCFEDLASLVDLSMNYDTDEERRQLAKRTAYAYKRYINYLSENTDKGDEIAKKHYVFVQNSMQVIRYNLHYPKQF
jgi:hypothetical protein